MKSIEFDNSIGCLVIKDSGGFYSEPDKFKVSRSGEYSGVLNGSPIKGVFIRARRSAGFDFEYFTVE